MSTRVRNGICLCVRQGHAGIVCLCVCVWKIRTKERMYGRIEGGRKGRKKKKSTALKYTLKVTRHFNYSIIQSVLCHHSWLSILQCDITTSNEITDIFYLTLQAWFSLRCRRSICCGNNDLISCHHLEYYLPFLKCCADQILHFPECVHLKEDAGLSFTQQLGETH